LASAEERIQCPPDVGEVATNAVYISHLPRNNDKGIRDYY
jgi:hypothetical protein